MGFHVLLSLPKVAWRQWSSWILEPRGDAQPIPVRARGALDLNRDTARHRVHTSKYEDLLK